MKKLFALTLCSMVLAGCDDSSPQNTATEQSPQTSQSAPEVVQEKPVKAISPEKFFDIPFTKTERGRVILNNAIDLFRHDYDIEDKTIVVKSENPLKLTLKESVFEDLDQKDIRNDLERKFIANIFEIFAHLNVDSVDLTLEPIKQNGKPYGKNAAIKGKVTRENALKVLQTYSAMKSFDDYISFDKDDEYNILGYSRSKQADEFNREEYRKQILTGLLTGKIEQPYEVVKLPLDVDFTTIQVKLKQAFDLSLFQNDSRELANGNQEYSTTISDVVRVYAIGKGKDKIEQVAVQFAVINDANIVMQSTGGIAAAMLATPNPDKSFNTVTSMMDTVGKKMKKSKNKESIEETKLVDGLTLKLTVHPRLGGIAFLTIEKLEKQPKVFN
ncbi:hypothetical protein BKK51_04550 [Rodentibacter trehalosifermentans]|uniref:Lipoprotein n=1 Tax=Rodentibacter trehalosifermentans TaxID=1908263 RepID=A0A1V3IVA3_9PAST|nr:hypothetical protein [Rodentibacter trehalosifermentans]OOF45998.1 hypothetical protein BKK51_04550 [Rodentibacter trehalosifermentans]